MEQKAFPRAIEGLSSVVEGLFEDNSRLRPFGANLFADGRRDEARMGNGRDDPGSQKWCIVERRRFWILGAGAGGDDRLQEKTGTVTPRVSQERVEEEWEG
jgi:hypothetical protein